MPEPESRVFRSWLALHGQEFDRFEFNVRLGEGVDPGPDADESLKRHARANWTKRADAMAWKGDDVTILEVKIRCGLGALGQLIGYRSLYVREFPQVRFINLLVVCVRVDKDVIAALKDNGVGLEVVAA